MFKTHSALGKFLQVTGLIILGLLGLLAIFMLISSYLYYSPQAANLPCRQCGGLAKAVKVNGFDLYFRELGQDNGKAPVVMVHGGPGMSSQTFKDGFDFLASQRRVIFYDQRGSGFSQIKPDPANYTFEAMINDLETLRRDVLKVDKMVLVGHSAGGELVQRYTLLYSQHVERMILVSSLPANGGLESSGPLVDAVVAGMNVLSGNLPPADPEKADVWYGQLCEQGGQKRLYDPSRMDLIQNAGYISFVTNREVTRTALGGNFDQALSQLPVKTLLIYGAADNGYTGQAVMDHLHSLLPDSTLVRFDKSGHWPYLEEPEKFRQVVDDFLLQ
jgi:proline iminopeptidase